LTPPKERQHFSFTQKSKLNEFGKLSFQDRIMLDEALTDLQIEH